MSGRGLCIWCYCCLPGVDGLQTATVKWVVVHGLCLVAAVALVACGGVPRHQAPSLVAVKARVRDSAPTAAAKVSLRTKQFASALRELQAAAELGDVRSQYLLGLMYANGLGTAVSKQDARRWLGVAADKSDPDAAYALAGLLAAGSREDRVAARRWLERAASEGHPFAIKLAASHSLPLAPARGASGDTKLARELLIWAIRRNPEVVPSFARSAGVETVDEFGCSPLAYAVASGSELSVEQLLAAGASPRHADHFGVTALMLAAAGRSDPVFELLLSASKDLDIKDSAGNTALFFAARVGNTRHVERLLAAGASVNGADADGWTALDVSSAAGHAEVAQALRKAGAVGSLKVEIGRAHV